MIRGDKIFFFADPRDRMCALFFSHSGVIHTCYQESDAIPKSGGVNWRKAFERTKDTKIERSGIRSCLFRNGCSCVTSVTSCLLCPENALQYS